MQKKMKSNSKNKYKLIELMQNGISALIVVIKQILKEISSVI